MIEFYVYAFTRSKPSMHGPEESPYYIGKGQGMRAYIKRKNRPVDPKHIVILVDGLNEEKAFEIERNLIAFYGRVDRGTGCLHNHTDGGEGVLGGRWKKGPMPLWHKEKLRKAFAGRPSHPQSIETREKIRLAKTGISRPKEVREKISLAKKGKPHPHKGNHFPFGIPRSEETKRKISATLKARCAKMKKEAL